MRLPRALLAVTLTMACAAADEATAPTPDAAEDVAPEAVVDDAPAEVSLDDAADASVAPDATPEAAADVVDAVDAGDAAVDAADRAEAPSDVRDGPVTDTADAPADAGALDDSLPTGAVMYFQAMACPRGWDPWEDGVGRVALPASSTALVGVQRGAPLADGEDRAHTHMLSGSFTLEGVTYAGIVGGGNNGLTPAAELNFAMVAGATSSGLPYVQLLVCRKRAAPRPRATPPAGMMVYVAAPACPSGYTRVDDAQGHLPVGLQTGGADGARFGMTPPGVEEPRPHRHEAAVELVTRAHGIALASGCCGSGYGRDRTYTATVTSTTTEAGPPTVQLLLCAKD